MENRAEYAPIVNKLKRFIGVANAIAAMSKNPKRKIGAIILSPDYNIVATGYNGCPRGVEDSAERYQQPRKSFYMAHAEENAIAQAARTGARTDGCYMLVTGLMPCAACTKMIIQAGIKVLGYPDIDELYLENKWSEDFKYSASMLDEAGVVRFKYVEEL